jgi:hypothetical protein
MHIASCASPRLARFQYFIEKLAVQNQSPHHPIEVNSPHRVWSLPRLQ